MSAPFSASWALTLPPPTTLWGISPPSRTTLAPIRRLPDHNLRTHEVVVRDNIGANRALIPSNTRAVIVLDGLGDIMISTIIYTIHTGFREPRIVPAVHTCDWRCAFEAYVLGLIGGILVGPSFTCCI
ncbi:hypothetical protein K438DRAFT_1989564 [Mycena galopus ATCC 62051]|nr:hypothetical protein K438DRAFT_1989564 [Mycena galopus ATCC 62051]